MLRKMILAAFVSSMLTNVVPLAFAGVPDLTLSVAVSAATEDVSILVCPACDGNSLDDAATFGTIGGHDATITVSLYDAQFLPVTNFPREDIWLQANGLCTCTGSAIADHNSNFNGQTKFTNPICGGGASVDFSTAIYVNGERLAHPPLGHIMYNSPDANCDFSINLSDIVRFANVFFGDYDYSADFLWDGAVNLSDVVTLTPHLGHRCP
jgi:hypothetical protein